MLYQDYKQKMKKIVDVLKVIRKYRVLILSILCAIIVLLSSFLITKGMFLGSELETDKIEYGSLPSFSAKALFSKVSYEYSSVDGGEWTNTPPTDVGSYKVRAVSKGSFGSVKYTNEYSFVIGKKNTTISVLDTTLIYGNNPTPSGTLAFGDKIVCGGYTYKDLTKKTTTVIPDKDKISILDKNERDVTAFYVITTEEKEITFEKRSITVTVDSDKKNYDGTSLSCELFDVTSETKTAFKDKAVMVEGSGSSITEAGQVDNDGEIHIINIDGVDVTHQYAVKKVLGTLKVDKRPVIINTGSGEFTYDGEEKSVEDYTVDASTPLADGHKLIILSPAKATTAGEINNIPSFAIFNKDNVDVTSNYAETINCGKIVILQREIHIQTPSFSIDYDGTAHSDDKYVQSNPEELASGDEITVSKATSITNVGKVENILTLNISNGEEDVTSSYKLIFTNGTLEINKRYFEISSGSLKELYNGKEQYNHDTTLHTDYPSRHYLDVEFLTSITDCDEVKQNEFKVTFTDVNGNIVTDNYEIKKNYGTLELIPLPVGVKTKGFVRSYDGTELILKEFDYTTENTFVPTQKIVIENAVGITNVSKIDNIFEIKLFDGEEDKTFNYQISYEGYGELEITPRYIEVSANSLVTDYYNGLAYSNPGYTIGGEGIAPNQIEQVVVEAEDYINAGVWINKVVSVDVLSNGESVKDNYQIVPIDGILEIPKRPVTIVSKTLSGVYYDGEIHRLEEVEISKEEGMGLVLDHYADVTFLSDSFILNTYNTKDNAFVLNDIKSREGNVPVTSNYDYTLVFGQLSLNKRPVTFISASMEESEVIYDGLVHTRHSFEVSTEQGMGLVKNQYAVMDYTGSILNAGEAKNTYTLSYIWDPDINEDVTGNYEYICQEGTLRLSPRKITFTSKDATKVYDGTTVKNHEIIIGGEHGLAPNQNVTFCDFPIVIDVTTRDGKDDFLYNTFKVESFYSTVDGDTIEILSSNYDMEFFEIGELRVKPRPITITLGSACEVYDGAPLTAHYFENTPFDMINSKGLLPIHYINIEYSESSTQTFVGTTVNTYSKIEIVYYDIVADKEVDVTSNYEIEAIDGSIEVTKRDITIAISEEDKKTYDGYALFPTLAEIGGLGLADSDTIDGIFNGSQTNAGTSGSYLKDWIITHSSGTPVNDCYNVTVLDRDGTLIVHQRPLTITSLGGYKEYYDGGKVESKGYIQSGLLENLEHTLTLEIGGEQINYGTSYDYLIENSVVILDKDGHNVTSNYIFMELYKCGSLVVEKQRPIIIESHSFTFIYNGEVHTYEYYSVLGEEASLLPNEVASLGLAPLREEKENVAFTCLGIKDVGYVDNTFNVSISVVATEEDTTGNYLIQKRIGKVIVQPLTIYIEILGDEKVYDSTPLENHNYIFDVNQLPQGQYEVIDITGTITDVGSVDNTYTIAIYDSENNPVPLTNFTIEETVGKLTVNKLIINVTTPSAEKEYDGTALEDKNATIEGWENSQAKANGVELHLNVSGSRLEPGVAENGAFGVLYKKGKRISDDNYEVNITTGILEVYAKPIKLISKTGQITYNIVTAYIEGVNIEGCIIASDHKLNVVYTNDNPNVGTHINGFTFDIVNGSNESVLKYYPKIETEFGKVTIVKRDISVSAVNLTTGYTGEKIYAPSEIKEPNDSLELLALYASGKEITYSIDRLDTYLIDIGETTFTIPQEYFHIYADGVELDMNNFNYSCEEAILKVVMHNVVITVHPVEKSYTGKLISYKEKQWSCDLSQLPEGYSIDVKLTGGRVEPGTVDLEEILLLLLSENRITVTDSNGNDVTSQFDFQLEGTPLTVKERALEVTAKSGEKVYDGEPLTVDGYLITGGSLARGHKIVKCVVEGSQTLIGDGHNTIKEIVIEDENGNNVTEYYQITKYNGTLTVYE